MGASPLVPWTQPTQRGQNHHYMYMSHCSTLLMPRSPVLGKKTEGIQKIIKKKKESGENFQYVALF